MKSIRSIQVIGDSNEELLPGFSPAFPYIASRAELDIYIEPGVPWHWHRTVELFYMESGVLEYSTPSGKWLFPAGTGGFVNSNVLHSSRVVPSGDEAIQLLHLFEPESMLGGHVERLVEKYIRPLSSASGIDMIALSPDDAGHASILRRIRAAFELSESDWGFEFALRNQLTDVWILCVTVGQCLSGHVPRHD